VVPWLFVFGIPLVLGRLLSLPTKTGRNLGMKPLGQTKEQGLLIDGRGLLIEERLGPEVEGVLPVALVVLDACSLVSMLLVSAHFLIVPPSFPTGWRGWFRNQSRDDIGGGCHSGTKRQQSQDGEPANNMQDCSGDSPKLEEQLSQQWEMYHSKT
jgi:hypothetical protein